MIDEVKVYDDTVSGEQSLNVALESFINTVIEGRKVSDDKPKIFYKGFEYNLIERNVRIGDIIVLNYGTSYEKIEEIHSSYDLNYISGFTDAIVKNEYYVLSRF